jgi:glycosyltransferase involved in cell wall biosynthesis
VTEAGDAWPSGRIRALSYRKYFAADGFDVQYRTRLNPALTKAILHPGRLSRRILDLGVGRLLAAANRCWARLGEARIASRARSCDAVYLQKVLSPRLISRLRRSTRARLVFDLNDGLWLPWMGRFAGGNVGEMLKMVDAVTCDNPDGLEFARGYNTDGFVVPDPPQIELFDQWRPRVRGSDSCVVLGWIGSASTAFNLFLIWEALERLFRRFENIQLRLIGAGYDWRLLPRFEKVKLTTVPFYSQEQMVREVLAMDIGLFPLFDVEDSLARGVLKATVYMAGEACVVASPVGQTRSLIRDGENGLLAESNEWLQKLTALVEDTSLRSRLATAGLQTVRENFTTRQCYEKLKAALDA